MAHRRIDPAGRNFQQTMIRITNPAKSLPFYTELFNMTLVDTMEFKEWGFSLYYLASMPPGTPWPEPGSQEAHVAMLSAQFATINLTHNHGDETKDMPVYSSGNVEPHRGFGHLAFTCEDVYASCADLESKGVAFQKKPDEGRMKGLAFAKDPDGYWLEIIRRPPTPGLTGYWLNQTMLRIKNPAASLPFYKSLGMSLIAERHFPDAKFSLYFMASIHDDIELPDPSSPEAMDLTKVLRTSVLELTHNHGTEDDPDFKYHDGNSDPKGFGHITFTVPDVSATLETMRAAGVTVKKDVMDGTMKGIAFVYDPDGYWVELLPHGWNASIEEITGK